VIHLTKGQETRSEDKRWNVEAYAVNLLKRDVEDLVGMNLIARFKTVSVEIYGNVHVE